MQKKVRTVKPFAPFQATDPKQPGLDQFTNYLLGTMTGLTTESGGTIAGYVGRISKA